MTTTAFAAAAPIRALIRKVETGHDGPAAYATIIGHRQGDLAKPITEMTIDEVLAEQQRWVKVWGMPSGAAGAYQIIPKTLRRVKKALGLSGAELFTPKLQDRLGQQLLEWRDLLAFLRGGMTRNAFGNGLAKEWASFPVFSPIKGAYRQLKAGDGYYDGDGINKRLVSVPEVSKAMKAARALWDGQAPAEDPDEVPDDLPDPALVRLVQQALWDKGYVMVGRIDGDYGKDTRIAIRAFEEEHGLPDTGTPSGALLEAILAAPGRGVSEAREEATPKEVRAEVPEVKANWFAKIQGMVLAVLGLAGAAIGGIVENIQGALELVQPALDTFADVPWYVYALVIAGAGAWLWWQSRKGEVKGIAAFRAGARR